MNTSKIETLDDFLKIAKQLRSESEVAEAKFLTFLSEFETQRPDLWKTAGTLSYESFLNSNHVVSPARYRNFCNGAKVVSDPERIGAGATVAAANFKKPTPEVLAEYEAKVDRFKQIHDVAPSEQHARTWVMALEPRESRDKGHVSKLNQLQAENAQLRAEIKELKRKLKLAEKKLESFRPSAA